MNKCESRYSGLSKVQGAKEDEYIKKGKSAKQDEDLYRSIAWKRQLQIAGLQEIF